MSKFTFIRLVLPLLGGLVCGGAAAQTQAQQPEPESYTYATYFYCDVTQQERVDEIAEKLQKPVYDAAVTDGTITSWGWMAHHTGGLWRRVDYITAPTLPGVFAASTKLNDQLEAKNKAMSDETGKICNSHDDYIWKRVAGFSGVGQRGNAAISVYHVCNMSREGEADELVKKHLAPLYDKMVADGQLISWSWMQHVIGGEYRRLEVLTGKDIPTLMASRTSLVKAMQDNPASTLLDEICTSHTDYIWEIKLSK